MSQGYLNYVNLYTRWLKSQMLNPGWQKLIELTQKGIYRVPLFIINPMVQRGLPIRAKSHTQKILSKICLDNSIMHAEKRGNCR